MHPAKVTRRKVSAVPPFTPVFCICRENHRATGQSFTCRPSLCRTRRAAKAHGPPFQFSSRFPELTPCTRQWGRHLRMMLAIPTGGGHRRELRSIDKARTSRNRFQECSRFTPAYCDFSRNFMDFFMFFLAPSRANLSASCTISRFREKMWTKVGRFFAAFRSSDALESPIAKNT
jgi:hypothetical protein